jgi:hypothetical protein
MLLCSPPCRINVPHRIISARSHADIATHTHGNRTHMQTYKHADIHTQTSNYISKKFALHLMCRSVTQTQQITSEDIKFCVGLYSDPACMRRACTHLTSRPASLIFARMNSLACKSCLENRMRVTAGNADSDICASSFSCMHHRVATPPSLGSRHAPRFEPLGLKRGLSALDQLSTAKSIGKHQELWYTCSKWLL